MERGVLQSEAVKRSGSGEHNKFALSDEGV